MFYFNTAIGWIRLDAKTLHSAKILATKQYGSIEIVNSHKTDYLGFPHWYESDIIKKENGHWSVTKNHKIDSEDYYVEQLNHGDWKDLDWEEMEYMDSPDDTMEIYSVEATDKKMKLIGSGVFENGELTNVYEIEVN